MYPAFIAPIQKEFEEFESLYKQSLSSDDTTLSKMFDMLYSSVGKQMRPALVLLSAKSCGGITHDSILVAIAVELLHLASLVHDDVVDEADLRRGKPSINSIFDNKLSILGGDCILSSALETASKTNSIQVINIITGLGKALCEGEILQYTNTKKRLFNEESYYSVIRKKTAALFSACAKLGSLTATDRDKQTSEIMTEYGNIVGTCFQIKDDIFDYSPKNHTGKPNGKDLDEGKATLPLIHIYDKANDADRKIILNAIDDKNIILLQQMADELGGLDYAKSVMDSLKQKAIKIIEPIKDPHIKTALEDYISYIVDREK